MKLIAVLPRFLPGQSVFDDGEELNSATGALRRMIFAGNALTLPISVSPPCFIRFSTPDFGKTALFVIFKNDRIRAFIVETTL